MRCEKYESAIIAYALGELSPDEASECQSHIDGCPECRQAYDKYLSLAQCMGSPPEAAPTTRESESLTVALDRAAASPSRRESARPGMWTGRALRVCLAACAIAAVALATWTLVPHRPLRQDRMPGKRLTTTASAPGAAKPAATALSSAAKHPDIVRLPKPDRKRPPALRIADRRTGVKRHRRVYVAVKKSPSPIAPQQPQSPTIPPDVAYRAGALMGQGLNTLAVNASPEARERMSERLKQVILRTNVKTKGESNEKSNSSDPVDDLNGGTDPSGALRIQACAEAGAPASA